MKNLILGAILLFSLISFSQNLTYDQVKAIKEKKEIPTFIISSYVASNGVEVKTGDKFRLNRPEGGSKTFVSITNKPTGMDFAAAFLVSTPFKTDVSTSMSNTEITIKKIYVSGTRKLGFKMFAELATCDMCNNLLVDIELAIETKEVRSNSISSEDALGMLKSEKDKLDLGIITQDQFNSKKEELIKYIN